MPSDAKLSAHEIEQLRQQCSSGDRRARVEAMYALYEANACEALPELLQALSSEDASVRATAVEVMPRLGGDDEEQVGAALVPLLADPDDLVRNQAAEAFCVLRYAPAIPALERLVRHDSYWVARASAAEALGELGDARALDSLFAALGDEWYPVRGYAGFSIGQLGDERHLAEVQKRLEDEDHPSVRAELLAAAMRFGDAQAFDELIALMGESDTDVEPMMNLLRAIDGLLREPIPAVVIARAAELDDALSMLGQRSGWEEDTNRLRGRLAALLS
ncbi:HEAT repeat domain-containing protein [Haliangium sp.]|uniref:HEAT repeat domain-containing protein n=1 Tax=Haliangium sp. TaxID=2663208 RepID=UPI003D14EF91